VLDELAIKGTAAAARAKTMPLATATFQLEIINGTSTHTPSTAAAAEHRPPMTLRKLRGV